VQLIIPLEFKPDFVDDDFVCDSSNIEAYKAIRKTDLWPEKRLMIVGDAGSGKSHLATVWAHAQNAEFYHHLTTPSFTRPIVIEDINSLYDEYQLFHFLNSASQASIPILLTAKSVPQYKTPDLMSRIDACYKVLIKEPSTDLLKAVLLKSLCDRQIKIPPEVLDYITVRMTRNFAYIQKLASNLDKISAQEKRSITIPFVKKIMEKI
jgi:chromosomal replication initiation ATPase DnaA